MLSSGLWSLISELRALPAAGGFNSNHDLIGLFAANIM